MRALRRGGHRFLGRNVRAVEAELDALAREGGDLVVVEVKSGYLSTGPRGEPYRPLDRVTRGAVRRRRAAAARMARRGEGSRVDVVEVAVDPGAAGRPVAIELFKGVEPTASMWPWAR